MYRNVSVNSVIDSACAKRSVLRYVASGIGLGHPTAQESELATMMSHVVGACYAPEDTWPLLNLIHNSFESIIALDCTLDFLIVVGYPVRHATFGLHEIQAMADRAYVITDGLETEFESGVMNKTPYGK